MTATLETIKALADAAQVAPVQSGDDGRGPERPKTKISERINRDLLAWGYDLWLNDMDDGLQNGANRMTDADRAQLKMRARDEGYANPKVRLLSALDDAILALAAHRRRHPVRDYLNALRWDGGDHIGILSGFFEDKHDPITYENGTRRTVFHAFLRRWLVGSIAKIFGDENAARSNFALVLASDQDAGKSHFANWLCPLGEYFIERHVSPDDKDCSLQRCRRWIWEISEMGATTRRADVESLKAFITTTKVIDRAPYGHFDLIKPAVASYVGTINPDGAGFLSDSTGNRRFAVVDLARIDQKYSAHIAVGDVWAQAMQLWRNDPKGYRFSAEESTIQRKNAAEHTAPDMMADALAQIFDFDTSKIGEAEWALSSSRILEALRTFAGVSRGRDETQGRELARSLKKVWQVTSTRSNGATVYRGLCIKSEFANK